MNEQRTPYPPKCLYCNQTWWRRDDDYKRVLCCNAVQRMVERDRRVERHRTAAEQKRALLLINLIPIESIRTIVEGMDYDDRQAIRIAARAILDTSAWEGDEQ